eukprot:m.132708 g.132708  ORF g.132708 m.132708 type:complete len:640 (-) comp16854_c0_seq4:188-2107(-)
MSKRERDEDSGPAEAEERAAPRFRPATELAAKDQPGTQHASYLHWVTHMLQDDIVKTYEEQNSEGPVHLSKVDGILDKIKELMKFLPDLHGGEFPTKIKDPPPAPTTNITIPNYDGKLYNDPYSLYRAADDFGHALHEYPALVARPEGTFDECAQQILAIVNWAFDHEYRVTARPASIFDEVKVAHSTWGQSQSKGGIVINTSELKMVQFHDGLVTVGSGAIWQDVLQACKSQNPPVTIPITTTNLFLTVGGTLSVLAAEYVTTTQGPAVDTIVEMVVVTAATGKPSDLVTCSKTQNVDLYNAVRCGLGEYGIIVSVTFEAKQEFIPQKVNQFSLGYLSRPESLAACYQLNIQEGVAGTLMEILTDTEIQIVTPKLGKTVSVVVPPWMQMLIRLPRVEWVKVWNIVPFTKPDIHFIYFVTALNYQYTGSDGVSKRQLLSKIPPPTKTWERNLNFFDYKWSLDPYLTLDTKFGSWNFPHTEVSYFLPQSELEPTVSEVLDDYFQRHGDDPRETKSTLYFIVSPYRADFCKAPGFQLPAVKDGEQIMLVSFMNCVRQNAKGGGQAIEQDFAELLTTVKTIAKKFLVASPDAKTFPWGYIPYSWKQHYGDNFPTQKGYKTKYDPKDILGVGVFRQQADLVRL